LSLLPSCSLAFLSYDPCPTSKIDSSTLKLAYASLFYPTSPFQIPVSTDKAFDWIWKMRKNRLGKRM
jgi:hypothetical protein